MPPFSILIRQLIYKDSDIGKSKVDVAKNYISELKKCGDLMYKKTQYWEFIKTVGDIELARTLSAILNINIDFIVKNGGAWFVDNKKSANYDTLSGSQQSSLNLQLDEMIASKCGWTPFHNYKVKGFPVGTIVNGILVMSEGKILVESKGQPLKF